MDIFKRLVYVIHWLAFCIGRKSIFIRSNNNILQLVKNKKKKNNSDSINPDAD